MTMRTRADNPHQLPPRLYERRTRKRIVWWAKARDNTSSVLRTIPSTATEAQIAAARRAAIMAHSTPKTRQARAGAATVADWIANTGIVEKEASKLRGELPEWARRLHTDSKRRAATRGILWSITRQDFAGIVERSAGLCEVSGFPLSLTLGKQKGPYGPSIDRISCDLGYTAGNVRIVCMAVNFALNSWGLEAFMPIARALTLRHPNSKDCDFGIPDGSKKTNGLQPFDRNPLNLLAEWTGLEPATPGVTGPSMK